MKNYQSNTKPEDHVAPPPTRKGCNYSKNGRGAHQMPESIDFLSGEPREHRHNSILATYLFSWSGIITQRKISDSRFELLLCFWLRFLCSKACFILFLCFWFWFLSSKACSILFVLYDQASVLDSNSAEHQVDPWHHMDYLAALFVMHRAKPLSSFLRSENKGAD